MKIIKVNLPKTPNRNDGLEDIKMDKLGQIVLIAGKNGSGKTRILDKIFTTLTNKPTKNSIAGWEKDNASLKDTLASFEKQLRILQSQLTFLADQQQISQKKQSIAFFESEVKRAKRQIVNNDNNLHWNLIETNEIADKYISIPFVPKKLDLQDCNSYNKNDLIKAASRINEVGVGYLPQGTLAKIQVIQDRWHEATHPDSKVPEKEKQTAISDYKKLKELIEIFLNTSIGRTLNSEATLFGFPMGRSKLSDGQKVLLQFCLAIYTQETELKDLILILDEPENHLHPSVIIETLDRIQKYNSNGQIWIATHSLPLLAHFDPSLIWYVENNKITHAGKIPEKVLYGLLGDENEIAKLQDFISLPAQYATCRYAFESLIEPSTTMTSPADPQSFQVRTELVKLTHNEKLRILDYGAGQGRIISNIFDLEESNHSKLIEKLDYIAFDKSDKNKELCESVIKKVYGNFDNRYFNDINKLLSIYDKKSFNIVMMCNVLHEIDPKDWLKLFSADGLISSLLADNGILLLVEDHQMPIGEKAYQKGFLVLDTPQLKDLFKITEADKDFVVSDIRGDSRLKAHKIPKNCLIRIDADSRLAALKSLSTTAREKISEIRNMKEQNYQTGKLHGFWTQQFANAQLNIVEFTKV